MGYTRFLPLITPLISLFLLEVFYKSPLLVYAVILIIVSLYLFTIREMILEEKSNTLFFKFIAPLNIVLIFILAISIYGSFEWFKVGNFFSYIFWYRLIVGLNIIYFIYLSIDSYIRNKHKAEKNITEWWIYAILPIFFTISIIMFVVLIPIATTGNKLFVQLLFLVNTFFLYNYFEVVYFYFNDFSLYKKNSIENFSSYGNFLTVYFFASAIYGFQSFLSLSNWILMIFILVLTCLLAFQVLFVNRIDKRAGLFYSFFIGLLIIELAWSVSFLSLSYYILGIIVAINYYLLIGLTRFYLLKKIDKNIIKLYLTFSFGSLLLILLTSRWLMS